MQFLRYPAEHTLAGFKPIPKIYMQPILHIQILTRSHELQMMVSETFYWLEMRSKMSLI